MTPKERDWTIEIKTVERNVQITFRQGTGDWMELNLTTVQTISFIDSLKKHLQELNCEVND